MTIPAHLHDDPELIDRLDTYLDALVLGETPPVSLDPTLTTTATSLQRARIAPDPDPTFAASLRTHLLAPTSTHPSRRRFLARAGTILLLGFPPSSRWLPATAFASMLLIVVALFATLTGGFHAATDWFDDDEHLESLAGISASPTTAWIPDPSLCTAPPVDVLSLAATVNAVDPRPTVADMTTATAASNAADGPGAQADTPADDATNVAARAAIEEWVACSNAGGTTRMWSLFNREFLFRTLAEEQGAFQWQPDPDSARNETPVPNADRAEILELSPASFLPDGRVMIEVILEGGERSERTRIHANFVMIQEDGRWLIDGIDTLDVSSAADATPTPRADASPAAVIRAETFGPGTLYPPGSMVSVIKTGVTVRAAPSSDAEVVGRLSPALTIEMTGPVIDAGDRLWYPIVEPSTCLAGYVRPALLGSPFPSELGAGYTLGEAVMTLREVRLREQPSPNSPASEIVPAETELRIVGVEVLDPSALSGRLTWWPVQDPATGALGYVLPDFIDRPGATAALASTATSEPTCVATSTPSTSIDVDQVTPSTIITAGGDNVNGVVSSPRATATPTPT